MRVLAGDVGGTKTLLQLVDFDTPAPRGRVVAEQRFESGRYPALTTLAGEFLDAYPQQPIHAACLALAGPVREEGPVQRVQLTNLPWHESSAELADRLAIPQLRLINDFQAVGYGVEALAADELFTLQEASPVAHGPRLVVGAGTGLGVALLHHDGQGYRPLATEAGHVDFAPASALQWRLQQWLAGQHGHVSWERLVSGPGLETLYDFLCGEQGADGRDLPLLKGSDRPAAIATLAQAGGHPLAEQALDLFVELYGAFSGNMALSCLPRGGLFIAGGIAPKIRGRMAQGDFMGAFRAKGRMAPLLAEIPVHLVTEPQVGLLGAALVARRLLR